MPPDGQAQENRIWRETDMIRTLKDFWHELGTLSYDSGDYALVRSKFRDSQIDAFVKCFLPGTEILKDGRNGAPVVLQGTAETDKGATGAEEIDFHGYQLFDYSDSDGKWVVITLPDQKTLETHLLGEAGYLNFYSTEMYVFEDGVFKPFEIMFNGDNDTVVPIDKNQMDSPLDIKAMQGRIWVRWMDPEELKPLTDEQVEAYKRSIGR